MTYKEFYGSDYDTFKNVLDKVLNTIHSNALACIQLVYNIQLLELSHQKVL